MLFSYASEEERISIIEAQALEGYVLKEEMRLFSGNSLRFVHKSGLLDIPETPLSDLELLQQKVQQQDEIIEEILFDILPNLMGV